MGEFTHIVDTPDGMEKYFSIPFHDENGGVNIRRFHPSQFVKTAGVMTPLEEFLSQLKEAEDHIYIIVNALGADEYYGSNRNGDGFPESALQAYHKTFETSAKVFRHHKNKPDDPYYGKPIFSYYNPHMHRVELVLDIDGKKLPEDLLVKILNNEYPPFSMGCKVPYDICSICNNKAKTTKDYCKHLKRSSINSILPDGRRARAINTKPKFFDISFVRIPADKTAYMLKKIGSMEKNIPASIVDVSTSPQELSRRAQMVSALERILGK